MEQLKPLLIGFGHHARNGKDSVANFIMEKYDAVNAGPYNIGVLPFGRFIKSEVNAAAKRAGGMLQLYTALRNGHWADAPPLPDWVGYEYSPDMTDPLSPLGKQRTLLQWWGEEYRRAQDPFYWIKRLHGFIAGQVHQPEIVLIPDIRRKPECFFVKSQGGELVNVTRLNYSDPNSNSEHITETELDDFKYDHYVTAENLDQLRDLSYQVFDQIMLRHNATDRLKLAGVEVG